MTYLTKSLRTLSPMFAFLFLAVPGPMLASPPNAKPTPAVCKAALKEWSAQKTETLTLDQINEPMNMMVACADEAHHHRRSDKRTMAYLNTVARKACCHGEDIRL